MVSKISKSIGMNKPTNNPVVPKIPSNIGPFCLCLLYAEGKLSKPIIKTSKSKMGCINSSETAIKPIDPTPPQRKRLNKTQ